VSNAGQQQGQQQAQQQSQTATGGNSQGGSASIVQKTERQAPAIGFGGFIVPTFGCGGSLQAGASAPVGGIAFGKSTKDKECNSVRLANEFIAMGNFEAAAKVLCATKSAREAKLTIEDCRMVTKPSKPEPMPMPVVVPAPREIIVPAPQVTITVNPIAPPEYRTEMTIRAPKPAKTAKRLPKGCHYEPSKIVTRKLVCE